jgi:hypothetical protein
MKIGLEKRISEEQKGFLSPIEIEIEIEIKGQP